MNDDQIQRLKEASKKASSRINGALQSFYELMADEDFRNSCGIEGMMELHQRMIGIQENVQELQDLGAPKKPIDL